MIEIEENNVRLNDLNKLLRGNPVDAIFESLKKIWENDGSDFSQYYQRGEALTAKFEEQIFEIYQEVYDKIIHNIERDTTVKEILLKERFCLIIMDGMSLREASLVLDDLMNFGSVSYKYTYSALPSDTEFFTIRNFNAKSPTQIKSNENYDFIHLQREDKIEDIITDKDGLVIWSTYPDKIFSEFKSGFETQDLEKVGKKTKEILLKLLEHLSDQDEIIIISDHGYFVDTFSWKGLSDFPSGDRYAPNIPESLKKYCKFANDHWILVGRYNTIKRGKYVHVRHGGLSFLETIIPLIEIRKNGGKENAIY